MRYLKRRFVSFAVPKPAYCRIVQRRPRYIVARIPRVYGGEPGIPRFFRYSSESRVRGAERISRGSPLFVRSAATLVPCALALLPALLRFTVRFRVANRVTRDAPPIRVVRSDQGER